MRPIYLLLLGAMILLGLTLFNASWIAPAPQGRLVLVAKGGITQSEPATGACPAREVAAFDHLFIENTLFAMHRAIGDGARGLALDVQASADGRAMIFRDRELDCRTNGRGPVSAATFDQLRGLDIGFSYSADGGRSFPLRGRGIGAMPVAEEVIRAFPREHLLFTLSDARAADALRAAFAAAGTEIGPTHIFSGPPEAMDRIRPHLGRGSILDPQASETCLAGYRRTGWYGGIPGSCREAILILPAGGEWTLWGWPYRFLDRMRSVEARFLMVGEPTDSGRMRGLDRPEQLSDVPRQYKGLLLIEDMYGTGRALVR